LAPQAGFELAAVRSASTLCNQLIIGFQLALFWSTIFKSLNLHD